MAIDYVISRDQERENHVTLSFFKSLSYKELIPTKKFACAHKNT